MIAMEPIGRVRGGRAEAIDDDWGASRAAIELDRRFARSEVREPDWAREIMTNYW